jgi:CDP-glucose 4,6-dehydratase
MVNMFKGLYKGKKVLVTGNTGFKGAWLSLWLHQLGAEVYGLSKDVPTKPSLFEIAELSKLIKHTFEDIRNLKSTIDVIESIKPDFIFHLAAQPIVKLSYDFPADTMSSNIIGTVNILEALRILNFDCTAVMITSDKCYDNVEWEWGYKESDALGGKDPYSASKGAAELMIKTYFYSYFNKPESKVNLSPVRAGNVIGGADWAANRLVPDMFKSWSRGETVTIRSPYATRPWQHVLEPLSGYLKAGEVLYQNKALNGMAFNFGPNSDQNKTVLDLLKEVSNYWDHGGDSEMYTIIPNSDFLEAGLLKLNCDRALHHLKWKPTLNFSETVQFTAHWYNEFYNRNNVNMLEFTNQQIAAYMALGLERNSGWD